MSILGVESVVFGVSDVKKCATFWTDFGLNPVSIEDDCSVLDVATGSTVVVMAQTDARLPPESFPQEGIKLTYWGVDNQANIDTIVSSLKSDGIEVKADADGSPICQCPDGQWIGFRVWTKKPVVSQPDAVNAPGCIQRLNQHRKWRHRAIPKSLNHVVFFSDDYVSSFEFYKKHLGFRYTDHSKGVGIFARANGTNEHHSIFWVNSELPVAPGHFGYMHIAFGVDDIDELMLGANIMEKKGWKNSSSNSSGGISRHRISSAMYYYCDFPGGGEAEYHADTDYLDDNWVPRAWDFKFGSLLWSHNTPPIFRGDDIPWDMTFDKDEASFEEFRKSRAPTGDLGKITEDDEHAL